MEICVVGTGYVGLVTGTCLAEVGNNVWCMDTDAAKINGLKSGALPIYEPGLEEILVKNVRAGRLNFTTDLHIGIANAMICFIAVGTPSTEDGSADISHVIDVARTIGAQMNRRLIIVNKSTVPIGTTDKVREIIRQELIARGKHDLSFDVVSNPEFLKEGMAVEDFMQPDRVIIGTESMYAKECMTRLYTPIASDQRPLLIMDTRSAEITKYAANAMLATRISFINEIAQFCDLVGGNVEEVRTGIGTDRRIGMKFLNAGVGYGGSCFPKDVKELISTGRRNGLDMEIITAVDRVNERQKQYLVTMVTKRFGKNLTGKRLGVWGLAFKPMTDDMREAPSIAIIQALIELGASIAVFDPQSMEKAKDVFTSCSNRLRYVEYMMEAVEGADAMLLITEWPRFQSPDFSDMKRRMRQHVIFDGRNIFDVNVVGKHGFEYYCIGRNCYVK